MIEANNPTAFPRPATAPRRPTAKSRMGARRFLAPSQVPLRSPLLSLVLMPFLLTVGLSGGRVPQAQGVPTRSPAELSEALKPLLKGGGVIVGHNDGVVYQYQPGHYRPASIIKIATSLAALHYLGPDYRFRTEIYRDGDTLYLRGYGDPFMVSEEWGAVAQDLAKQGVFDAPLSALVLDTGALEQNLRVDGLSKSLNPYDAPPGALVSNFNTINVKVLAGGRVESAEPQTPLTPTARRLAHRLNLGTDRINLAARGVLGVDYTAELVREIFQQAGAKFTGPSRQGAVPKGLKPVLTHYNSRPLTEIIRGLLEFSNNFIANQIVLAIALEKRGEPARLADGVALILTYLRELLGLQPDDLILAEGSGLSLQNRVSLGAMLRITDAFYPWRHLLRIHGEPPLQVSAKTGSMTAIYTLAGFLPAPEGERWPFVIILNQRRHVREKVLQLVLETFPRADKPLAANPAKP